MHSLGIFTPPVASNFLQQQGQIIPDWYKPLLFRTRAHVAAEYSPLLSLAPKLDDASGALTITRQRLQALQQAGYSTDASI
jgi:hypothetical protein